MDQHREAVRAIRHGAEDVILRDVHLTDAEVHEIADEAGRSQHLRSFGLIGCGVTPAGGIAIAAAVELSGSIRTLELGDNRLGDLGAHAVATAVEKSASLRALWLNYNQISDLGAQALAKAIEKSASLRSLILFGNNLTDVGALALAAAARRSESLREVELTYNAGVTSAGRAALAAALKAARAPAPPPSPLELAVRSGFSPQLLAAAREAFEAAVRRGDAVPWLRSKLMVVGEGSAGKTSTVRSFLGEVFNPDTESTLVADASTTLVVERAPEGGDVWVKREDGNEFATQAARAAAAALQATLGGGASPAGLAPPESMASSSSLSVAGGVAYAVRRLSALKSLSSVASFRRGSSSKFVEEGSSSGPSTPRGPHAAASSASLSAATGPSSASSAGLPRSSLHGPVMQEADIAKQFDASLVWSALASAQDPLHQSKLTLSVWDFGGQDVFYSLHHALLTSTGVYCCVFRMSDVRGPEATEETRQRCVARLRAWLGVVALHAPDAPIFLVGTRKDEVPSGEDHVAIHGFLDASLNLLAHSKLRVNPDAPAAFHSPLNFWPVDNTRGLEDATVAKLRTAVVASIRDADHVKASVPLSWVRALDLLTAARDDEERTHASLHEVVQIAAKCGVPAAEVEPMLALFHELGVVVYFRDSQVLRSVVVLDPQWLVSALAQVIRDFDVHDDAADVWGDAELRELHGAAVRELRSHALLSKELLYYLWRAADEAPGASETENRDFLLAVMRHLALVTPWRPAQTEVREGGGARGESGVVFLVPSLLAVASTAGTVSGVVADVAAEVCMELAFGLGSEPFLPPGLFPRLVALAVEHSTLDLYKRSRTPALTKTRALLSFGDVDFFLELLPERDAIRVGVGKACDASYVRERLLSMLDLMREEVMTDRLRCRLLLLVPTAAGELRGVAWEDAVRNRSEQPREPHVRAVDDALVDAPLVDVFFPSAAGPSRPLPQVPALPADQFHVFFASAMSMGEAAVQCSVLRSMLALRGVRVWGEADAPLEPAEAEAEAVRGVAASRAVLVFLSKRVFEPGSPALAALRAAAAQARPLLPVHETDPRSPAFERVEVLLAGAPADVRAALARVESVPYRRRLHEREAMMSEVARRLTEGM